MRVRYESGFRRDIRRIRDTRLRLGIEQKIENLRAAASITELAGVRKVRSSSGHHYRIRIGEHRLGIIVQDDVVTLSRFSHRREFYRRFP